MPEDLNCLIAITNSDNLVITTLLKLRHFKVDFKNNFANNWKTQMLNQFLNS